MLKRTVRLVLNNNKFGSQTTVEGVHKGDDNSCELIITLTDGYKVIDLGENPVAVMSGTKPDGTVISNPCEIVDGNIKYILTKPDTAVSGNVLYQVTVADGNNTEESIIASAKFTVAVMNNIYIPIYRPLEEEPTNWNENYSSYYELVGNAYKLLDNSICPEFETNTFYYLVNPNYDSEDSYNSFYSSLVMLENLIGRASDILIDLDKAKEDILKRYTKTEIDVRLANKIDNVKGSVSTGNLEDGAVTTVKIADDSIKESHIKNYAVGTEKLADGAVTKDKIEYGAVGEEELATELLNLINSKLDESKIGSQISTISTNATSGSWVDLRALDKKWVKDTVIKITVSADESVINGTVTLGVKYDGDTSSTKIDTPLINEEVTYLLTADTSEIGVYIPKEHVVGDGEVTLTVETLGLKSDVAMLFSSILDIIETLTKKAETDNVYSKTESDKLFLTSVSTSNIINEAVTGQKLSKEVIEIINSKVDSSEVKAQTSTVVTNAVSGSQVAFWAPDKKWVKDTVIKITVSADESVINGTVTLGVKYDGDTSSTQIDTLINEEVTYLLTGDTSEIGVYIPKEHVLGNGEVTLNIESVGLRTEVVELKGKVSDIETDIDNLRNETPIAKSSIEGKTFSVIGDSCSAYAGWVPEGQKSYYGNPDENETNVTSVSQMWWYILSSQLKMSLLVNDSWMGTTMSTTGYKDANGNHADMTASAFTTRATSLFGENNTTSIKPDYIFVFGGTNDKRAGAPVGELKYSDWTTEDLKSVLPSFCKLINDIQLYNPQATIINITFDELIGSGIDSGYAEACEHYGITNVVLSDIVQADGHPSWEGQLSIAEQVINKLREEEATSEDLYNALSKLGVE